MGGRENTLKKYLIRIMGTRWHAQSHEDMLSVGIPDLSFACQGVSGWIELKHIIPPKTKTVVKPSKFTNEQINWMAKRMKHGGLCFVMVHIDKVGYFLLNGNHAGDIATGMEIADYKNRALGWWEQSVDVDEFVSRLILDKSTLSVV